LGFGTSSTYRSSEQFLDAGRPKLRGLLARKQRQSGPSVLYNLTHILDSLRSCVPRYGTEILAIQPTNILMTHSMSCSLTQ